MHEAKKLLTSNVWEQFQKIFKECGLEVYGHREPVRAVISEKSETERAAKDRRQTVNELMERTRDLYWRVEERGDPEQIVLFIEKLKNGLGSILN